MVIEKGEVLPFWPQWYKHHASGSKKPVAAEKTMPWGAAPAPLELPTDLRTTNKFKLKLNLNSLDQEEEIINI